MAASQKKDHHIPKYILALTHFVNHSMIQLEALNLYGDTCLNTTVSALTHNHGLTFIKKSEPHRNKSGGTVHFMRYWLSDDSQAHARHLISRYLPHSLG